MKNGHYEGSDIKPLDTKGIDKDQIKLAAEKHQLGFGNKPEKK